MRRVFCVLTRPRDRCGRDLVENRVPDRWSGRIKAEVDRKLRNCYASALSPGYAAEDPSAARPAQHTDPPQGSLRAVGPEECPHVCLRADGLRLRAYRQCTA